MQGGTVERAIVVASPRDLTAGWSYTALSRARGETRILIVDAGDHERCEFAPAGSALSQESLLARVAHRMVERDDEDLAVEQLGTRVDDHSERSAERAEPALPDQILKRHEDLDAHVSTLNSQAERITARLAGLRMPQGRHVGRSGSPDDITIVHLQEVLETVNGEIARATEERDRLTGDLDVNEQPGIDNELSVERLAEVGRNVSTRHRSPGVRERSGMDRTQRGPDDGFDRAL
jgi:hypothetical protein